MFWNGWGARNLGGGYFSRWRNLTREASGCAGGGNTIIMNSIFDGANHLQQSGNRYVCIKNAYQKFGVFYFKGVHARDTQSATFLVIL